MFKADEALDAYRTGSTEPWTVDILCAIIRAQQPKILIETGTFEGKTTRRIFEVLESFEHGSSLFTIENDPERHAAVSKPEDWMTKHAMVAVHFGCGDALEFLASRPDDFADFIFLDDDHDASHVAKELREAKRILRPNGIIAVHDVIGPFNLKPVVEALGGVALDLQRLHAAGGLGLVTK